MDCPPWLRTVHEKQKLRHDAVQAYLDHALPTTPHSLHNRLASVQPILHTISSGTVTASQLLHAYLLPVKALRRHAVVILFSPLPRQRRRRSPTGKYVRHLFPPAMGWLTPLQTN